MNVEGSPIQLYRRGYSCSSMGSRKAINLILNVYLSVVKNYFKKRKKKGGEEGTRCMFSIAWRGYYLGDRSK